MLVNLQDRVSAALGGWPKNKKWQEEVIVLAMDAFDCTCH
jgi:hypothetical protein